MSMMMIASWSPTRQRPMKKMNFNNRPIIIREVAVDVLVRQRKLFQNCRMDIAQDMLMTFNDDPNLLIWS